MIAIARIRSRCRPAIPTAATIALLSGLGAAPAIAQESDVASLEEVVVTARKREESLLEIPISVQAFSEAELRESGVNDLRSLQAVAGFAYPQASGTAAGGRTFGTLVFRGLSPDLGLAFENSGSVFIDGVLVSGGVASVNMVDVQRVEVLKGPQNAYFGRSTFGGAINLITSNPATEFGAKVNATLTDRGTNNFDLTIEGPLFGDSLRGRLTVANYDKAGQYKTSDGGVLGDEKSQSITATLYANPTDRTWLRFRGHYQEDDDSAAAIAYLTGTSCAGRTYPGQTDAGVATVFRITQPYVCDAVPEFGSARNVLNANTALPASAGAALANVFAGGARDPFLDSAPDIDHSGLRRDTLRLALQGGVELPAGFNLEFNYGYNKSDSVSIWDLDRSAVQNFLNIQPVLTSDMTADVRVTSDPAKRLRGLLGVSYFRQTLQISQIDLNAAFGLTAFTLNTGNFNNNKAKVPAVYGSVDFDLTDSFTLTADLRYQKDKVTNILRVPTAAGQTQAVDETSELLPRVIATWQPAQGATLYASYAKGVQPLTLNTGYVNANAAQRAYIASFQSGLGEFSEAPELDTFEIGAKQSLFEGRLQYTLAIYDSKWKDRITFASIFNPPTCNGPPLVQLTPACPLGVAGVSVAVANDAKVRGVEFTVNGAITPKWTAGLNLNWTDATWDRYYNGNFGAYIVPVPPETAPIRRWDGNELAKVPDVTAALTTRYGDKLTGDWSWYARGDVRYQGKMWESDLNIIQSEPFTRVNLRFGLEKENVTLEFFADNLFNDLNWDYLYRLPNLSLQPLTSFTTQGLGAGAPSKREIGLRASIAL